MRLKPSIRTFNRTSARAKTSSDVAERLLAFQSKQESIEVIQNRIAQRLGGWGLLMQLPQRELDRITMLERRGELDDDTLSEATCRARVVMAHPP